MRRMSRKTFNEENPQLTDYRESYARWREYVAAYNQWAQANRPVVLTVQLETLLTPRDYRLSRWYNGRGWRDLDVPWDYPCVYVIKRHDGIVLYVGFSSNPVQRIQHHWGRDAHPSPIGTYLQNFAHKSGKWPVDLYPVRTRKEGLALEAKMIDEYQPSFNIASAA